MFKVKQNDLFAKNMSQGELYQVYKTFKAKQEMDKFLNKLITKNGVTNIQYVREKTKNNSNNTIYNTGNTNNITLKLFNN